MPIGFLLGIALVISACSPVPARGSQPVDRAALAAAIESADRIVVGESETSGSPILFQSSNHEDIEQLNQALTIVPPKWGERFACTCIAEPVVRLYRQDQLVAEVRMFNAATIGAMTWDSDARVADPERWLSWFDARNIPGPRAEYEESRKQAREMAAAWKRWSDAMPDSIRPLWSSGTSAPPIAPGLLHAFSTALAEQTPDTHQRILQLFRWFGSGAGPWSGFPAYESVAGELLLEFPTSDLVAAAQSADLDDRQLEGAARLFASWDFSHRRPGDRSQLQPELRKKLLDHVLGAAGGTDQDKRARALAAFAAT